MTIEPRMYTPDEWGAFSNPEGKGYVLSLPLAKAVIHTFAGASYEGKSVDQVMVYLRAIEKFHVNDRGFASIGYSFMVSEAGDIFMGRGWKRSGAHTQGGMNTTSYGIGLIGHGDVNPATPEQVASVQWLLAEGIRLGHLAVDFSLHGHREFAAKSCPGDLIYPLVVSEAFRPVTDVPPIPDPPIPEVPPTGTGTGSVGLSMGETAEDFVMNCYLVYLGRFATEENIDFWVKNFPDLSQIEYEISNSPEAGLRADDSDWLNYILDRTVPQVELDRGGILVDLADHKISRLSVVHAIRSLVILENAITPDTVDHSWLIQSVTGEIIMRLNNG